MSQAISDLLDVLGGVSRLPASKTLPVVASPTTPQSAPVTQAASPVLQATAPWEGDPVLTIDNPCLAEPLRFNLSVAKDIYCQLQQQLQQLGQL